ncbi:amino acid ABC transporter substrate-binding protein [Alkalilimnicola sp. S0819]|uniref:amino acid ABC transporter substrate-binding protein n=1 Tax=Alkalilimnicola sp. S0819 TaxID=2613922 RepID=UPI00126177EE|nr:amino acid ABC transporter substrate-binding protein [Alkalilimnicola sp. S0819]KAB7619698.1 amino acid ABC transporter substrate-binding protein [Alkalilimnicola sp. S0819]MPQ17556.1 transporter substrate-binding domain-containing protein [Alkalilimnicola sp. S0819]
MSKLYALTVLLLGLGLAVPAAQAATLDEVRERGHLRCGVSQGLPGFSTPAGGQWSGLDVDFCRAVAAAVLGDAQKVAFTPLSAKERFTALQSGEIDLLSRNTTWTATRDTALGFNFAGVIFYDGQGFMVRKELGIDSARQLSGATLCANSGTTTELNMADYFRANGMEYRPVVFEKSDEVIAAYDSGRCDVYTTDTSGLYAQRIKLKNPEAHVILPEIISKEPLGPLVRQGDDQWFNIVKWTLFAMVNAEELGVNSANVAQMHGSDNPKVRRLLGADGSIGRNLGLEAGWTRAVISQMGNYGELYQRNLAAEPLNIPRGQNRLWTDGGLMYAPPFR